ncbi:MAG TPA: ABC transporter substrate-binding protein, partial [Acidimicrobiales bacterium]|nr:ABC transporter substrate-binding protein [Acidimicrobiales bacterium]
MSSRNVTPWIGLLVVLSLTLAACSGGGGGGTAGNLRVGYDFSSQFTNTFDPAKSSGNCDSIVTAPIYDTLIHLSAGGSLDPGLATSWSIQGDIITLHLRPGVKFSDGEAFNANAVKLGLLHNKKNTTLDELANINAVTVVNPLTVRITYANNTGIELLYGLTSREGEIPAPKDLNKANSAPVGAGPFTFVSYRSGSELVLKANPDYWDKSAYHLKGIDFIEVGVGPPGVTALESNAVDMVPVEAESYDPVIHTPTYGVAVAQSTAYLEFQFRLTAPFDNVLVRQAVEYAIDRAKVNQVVNAGQGEVATQTFPKNSPGYDPSIAGLYPYDPAKAKQLLAQAGDGPGHSPSILMVIPGGNITAMEEQGSILQSELTAVGFKVAISRVLGSNVEADYYISRTGNAFAAEHLGDAYPPDQLYDNFGKFQFVAIYNDAENQTLTTLLLDAFADGATAQT